MNINPNATRILCYGDSNTRGSDPESDDRYPANVRWTGVLQNLLGNSYEIIEEGLGGRTTNISEPEKPWKNGKTYLRPCLETHNPIDVLIITLGTNDVKNIYNKTAEEIAGGLEELILLTQKWAKDTESKLPEFVIVSPVPVDETKWKEDDKFIGSTQKSKLLGPLYEELAKKYNYDFVDLGQYIIVDPADGVHLSAESHKKIAEVLFEKIKSY